MYDGERGRFRGFIAAQEGWLTEGESGITGQSIAVIFEFPKAERRGRRTKVKRYPLVGNTANNLAVSSCGLRNTPSMPADCAGGYDTGNSVVAARTNFNANIHPNLDWPLLAREQAKAICRQRHGGQSVANVAIDSREYDELYGSSPPAPPDPIWVNQGTGANRIAYQLRPWTATCVKKVKGNRRR